MRRDKAVTTAKALPAIVAIPINIPDYSKKGRKMPLSEVTQTRPPKLGEVKQQRKKNDSDRQRWFEEKVLRLIARKTGSPHIPWRFEMPNGNRRQLDQGCVGHAMANGVLETPQEPEQILERVTVRETYELDASKEVERQKRLGMIASRPKQKEFAAAVQRNYGNRCAITGCRATDALQAAHLRTFKGSDDNDPSNGILLRADIHALLDALLITLTPDGRRLEVSPDLTDPSYKFLRRAKVVSPVGGAKPSPSNIKHHRTRFLRRRSLLSE